MNDLIDDLRHAARRLRHQPVFLVTAVLTLALALGANGAIFSVVRAVLLQPPPFDAPDELVVVWEHNIQRDRPQNVVAPVNYAAWRRNATSLRQVGAMVPTGVNLRVDDDTERATGALVTSDLFPTLGVRPAFGRPFTEADGLDGAEPVVALSHALWTARFGADPAVVGRRAFMNDEPVTIVAVMPEAFEGARPNGMEAQAFWRPLELGNDLEEYDGRYLTVIARLAPDASVPRAHEEMVQLGARLAAEHEYDVGWSVNVVPLMTEVVGAAGPMLLILQVAVALVLLIAMVNVGNLFLIRGAARQHELALRAALGAGRARLSRDLMAESLIVGGLAGGVALLLMFWGIDALIGLAPVAIPGLDHTRIDWTVMGSLLVVLALVVCAVGLVPALRASRAAPSSALHEQRTGMAPAAARARATLVVAQVALAFVLAVGAGLTARSLGHLRAVDPGFDADRVLTAQVSLAGNRYPDDARRVSFYRDLTERLEAVPGITSAGATSKLPLDGAWIGTSYLLGGEPDPGPGARPVADIRSVTPGYFRTMGIELLAGRDFAAGDTPDAPAVAVINQTMADTHWPGGAAGQHITVRLGDGIDATVIGVVGDVRHQGIDRKPRAMVYFPHSQFTVSGMDVVVRTDGDPVQLASNTRRAVRTLDAAVAVYAVEPMARLVDRDLARVRFATALLAGFALLALVLTVIGTYGVIAYSVYRRRRDMGIRLALGATERRVRRLVLAEGLKLVGWGVVLGAVLAVASTRVLRSVLYDLSPTDPAVLLGVAVVLTAAALLASVIPAWRISRLEPAEALRGNLRGNGC
ncbi:MAG TPA: ABC transporter permease [Gemmatimonadales bacterium]